MELELAKSIRSEQMTMTSGNSVKPTRADPRQDMIQKPGPGHSVNVGLALRGLRAGHGLSIRALASKSGLAVNTLSLIEHNKTSPSVLTLQQLASALGVPITAFFQNDAPKTRVAYVKGSQRSGAAFAHGTLEDLGSNLTERTIEPFVVTIESNANSGATPIVHTGHEFIYCLEGRILYSVEDETYLLEPGDSLLFESHLPHRWQNVEAAPARALMVLCPLESRDRPKERHFLPAALRKD
jgi:transcriptional regulator with XRE-family HTH domain